MPVTGYEPLPREETEDELKDPLSQNSGFYDAAISTSTSSARPATYYGETDQPSSEAEDEALLEKSPPSSPTIAELGESGSNNPEFASPQRSSAVRYLVIILALIVAFAALMGITAGIMYKGTPYTLGARRITMDHIFNSTFRPDRHSLAWVPEAGDGVFSTLQDGFIQFVDLKNNSTRNLVAEVDVKDEHGHVLIWSGWQLSPNMQYVLFQADYKKQWRHSGLSNYYVHHLETGSTSPLIPPSNPPITSYAIWSPSGEALAYVVSNDLYILTSPSHATPIRVTTSGNASLFHGVPDWVYEEEVFASDNALWWSPDSTKVAFLSFDETAVDEFSFPIYNPTDDSSAVVPYTQNIVMKYPKPGYNNPLVSVHVFDLKHYLANSRSTSTRFPAMEATLHLDWKGRHSEEDSIISEVAWVANETLIVKELNRNADDGNVVLFELGANSVSRSYGQVVRKLGRNGEEGDNGWIECAQNIRPLPESLLIGGTPAYLDIVPSPDGYNHIALFSPADSATPRFITSGKWEVTGGIEAIDTEAGLVYFQATHSRSSTERQIYSVQIPTINSSEPVEPKALTDPSAPAFYDVSFSPESAFYLLSYLGPNIPWQKLGKANDTGFSYILTSNTDLNKTYSEFESPVISFSEIESEGYKFNVKEIRPPKMDDSGRTKYPLLFHVYGGPNSQMVDVRFNRDWHHYLACGLQYVVVIVDGRGTGFKGRKHRNPVKGNLGFWETRDQINAARLWAAKPYTDPKRIGIWGWSYGGFMSSKVVEADAGIHSLAMSVAPVTSWRLYDSIYTERYMNLPDLNPGGYINASISNVTAFHKVDFLLMHGSGDDNVHFANSAHLLDMLTEEKVRNFRFRMFPDSDHRINRRGAQREVYEYMLAFLVEKWGKGGHKRGW